MLFDFHPDSFKGFHDTFLCPQVDGFDPVDHVKNLALRRPDAIVCHGRGVLDRELRERRKNFNSWADILAMLRSLLWNLARLLLQDGRVSVLDNGQYFFKIRSFPHPFRLISQLRGVNQVHSFWANHSRSILAVKFRDQPVSYSDYLDACRLIYDKALSQTTSQPRPSGSEGSGYLTNGSTASEIHQIELDFQIWVKKLAMKEGLMIRFKLSELPLRDKAYLAITSSPFLSCDCHGSFSEDAPCNHLLSVPQGL
jgi:hypothetical protein